MDAAPDPAFTKALPKVELHAHLTGSISRQCLHDIWLERKTKDAEFGLEDPLKAIPSGDVVDVVSFFPIFDKYIYALVSDAASITYATTSVLQDFATDGVRYLELRTTPRAIPKANITKTDYVNIVLDAIHAFSSSTANPTSTDPNLVTKLILSIDRKNSIEEAQEVISLALQFRHRDIVGIDLCGNPTRKPISHLEPAFRRAKAEGLFLTLHFAEIAQDGIAELEMMLMWRPHRLGHVIYVPETLREKIRKEKIGLELCLSCNVLAGLSKGGFGAHHFGEWWGGDVPIALSTDDVGIFESPLSNEYLLAAQHFHISRLQLLALSRSAAETIFGTEEEKKRLFVLLDDFETATQL